MTLICNVKFNFEYSYKLNVISDKNAGIANTLDFL